MTPAAALDTLVWDRAYAQVENHLFAYRVGNRLLRHQLAEEIVSAAAAQHELDPERDPVELAAAETERRLREWIDGLIGPSDESALRRFARGRAAVFFSRLPERCPTTFLDREPPSAEMIARLRTLYLEAGPDFEFASMVPREIDLGPVSSVADETWRTFAKWPMLRGVAMSALFVGLLGTAFYLVRF